MKTVSNTQFWRKSHYYFNRIEAGEIIIIKNKNGKRYTFLPFLDNDSPIMDSVCHEPNEETLSAMREAESGKDLETIDLKQFKKDGIIDTSSVESPIRSIDK